MSLGYSYPGLAQATGTRVDSAAKHTLAVKVHTGLMSCWCEDQQNSRGHLHARKEKYTMNKDELVLNVSQPLNDNGTIITTAKAYPAVVSNLGDMTDEVKNLLCYLYHTSKTGMDFMKVKQEIANMTRQNTTDLLTRIGVVVQKNSETYKKVMREIQDLPYFTAMGYCLKMAYACDLTGDTVGTCLIGGMQTVMNGAFEIKSGEVVQWYFDFEEDMFYRENIEDKKTGLVHQKGSRKIFPNNPSTDGRLPPTIEEIKEKDYVAPSLSQQNRKAFEDRNYRGDVDSFPKNFTKKNMIYPKPYKLLPDGSEHYGDKIRIFAKCINGGRGGDAIDIMLMTQCT